MAQQSGARRSNTIYSDFNDNFTVHPVIKDLTLLKNEEAVKRSIKNILQTNYYERRFLPRYGANIRRYLFEPITEISLIHIKQDIIAAINNYEPRANIIDVVVSSALNDNSVQITVTFSTINSLLPVTVTSLLTLDRVR